MHIPHVNLALIILSYGSFCNDESDNVNDAKHIDSFIPFSLRAYLLGHSHGVRTRQRWGGGGEWVGFSYWKEVILMREAIKQKLFPIM